MDLNIESEKCSVDIVEAIDSINEKMLISNKTVFEEIHELFMILFENHESFMNISELNSKMSKIVNAMEHRDYMVIFDELNEIKEVILGQL